MRLHYEERSSTIRTHEVRADGTREPQYISDGKIDPIKVRLNAGQADFYLGYRDTNRISFEFQDEWRYVDNEEIYIALKESREKLSFRTSGAFRN